MITSKVIKALEKVLLSASALLLLAIFLEISLVGKNLTYTTRFTPPSSENSLRNETYYTETQVLLIALSALLAFLTPAFLFFTFTKSKRYFFPTWVAVIALCVLALLLSIYYLGGSNTYRDYLSQIRRRIAGDSSFCGGGLGQKSTCVRVESYQASQKMTIAFAVLCSLCSLTIIPVAFLVNQHRRRDISLELVV